VKHKPLHSIFSIVMSLLVLISTVSFTVEKHYCGNTLIDVSIFSEVEKCTSEIALEKTTKKPCCKDTIDIVKGQDELQKSNSDFNLAQQDINAFLCVDMPTVCEYMPKQTQHYKKYVPPNIVYDLTILHEVFLI